MRTDGGGWTFVAFTPSSSTMQNFFRHSIGSYQTSRKQYGTTDQGYAIPSDTLAHTEMMISLGAAQPQQAHEKGKLFLLRYQKGSDFFTTGPLNGDTSATVLFKNGMYADYAPAETTGTTSQWSI